MSAIDDVKAFAAVAHGKQTYGGLPYMYHLEKVAEQLAIFGFDDEIYQAAGYLHDVLEDTNTPPEQIISRFGMLVYTLVYAVSGFGATRAERNEDIKQKLFIFPLACPIKAADRLANHQASFSDPATGRPNLIQMNKYYLEREHFMAPILRHAPEPMIIALCGQYARMSEILTATHADELHLELPND